jgi:hypothetical protein
LFLQNRKCEHYFRPKIENSKIENSKCVIVCLLPNFYTNKLKQCLLQHAAGQAGARAPGQWRRPSCEINMHRTRRPAEKKYRSARRGHCLPAFQAAHFNTQNYNCVRCARSRSPCAGSVEAPKLRGLHGPPRTAGRKIIIARQAGRICFFAKSKM